LRDTQPGPFFNVAVRDGAVYSRTQDGVGSRGILNRASWRHACRYPRARVQPPSRGALPPFFLLPLVFDFPRPFAGAVPSSFCTSTSFSAQETLRGGSGDRSPEAERGERPGLGERAVTARGGVGERGFSTTGPSKRFAASPPVRRSKGGGPGCPSGCHQPSGCHWPSPCTGCRAAPRVCTLRRLGNVRGGLWEEAAGWSSASSRPSP